MPITYAIKKVKNPKGIEGTNYVHGQAIKTGELTMEKLAKRINNSTTVTQGDCYAVLKSMKDHIIEALTEGQVVCSTTSAASKSPSRASATHRMRWLPRTSRPPPWSRVTKSCSAPTPS